MKMYTFSNSFIHLPFISSIHYIFNQSIGTFKSVGGTGGSGGENGGPGTIYVHKLPIENQDITKFVSNRTLFVDNHGRGPKNPLRNLTEVYNNFTQGGGVAWIIPVKYPDFVIETKSDTQIVLEELQIYRQAQLAVVKPSDTKSRIDLLIEAIDGDRTGHVHIGYNQSLYIGTGKLPNDLSVYHGGEVTLQGELRVAGVDVMIEGVMKNVENLTVVDEGKLYHSLINFIRSYIKCLT